MAADPTNSDRLDVTLESTRASVRRLEIETFRIRHDLTRIEAAVEEGFAGGSIDDLATREREHRVTAFVEPPLAIDFDPLKQLEAAELGESAAIALDEAALIQKYLTAPANDSGCPPETALVEQQYRPRPDERAKGESLPAVLATRPESTHRRSRVSPVVASLSFHSAILLLILSLSVATIVHTDEAFTTAYVDLGETSPVEIESLDLGQIAQLDETNLDGAVSDAPSFDVAGPIVEEITPVDFESAAGPTSLGDLGTFDLNPTESGALLAGNAGVGQDGQRLVNGNENASQKRGAGGNGAGRIDRTAGAAMFFGTKARGDRFVFVVDNSSSMKNGRLEMALAELVKTVESLTQRQSFYVIFVSDSTYPMFYPAPELDMLPATPVNKKRLTDWLPKAILASGKNRELIKAMNMAAALRPHAVYLLWDGDMKYSDTVRLDVMTHLTNPANGWSFTVHTIGMGITSADAEQNLTAIAQAHGGLYRRVEVPGSRKR